MAEFGPFEYGNVICNPINHRIYVTSFWDSLLFVFRDDLPGVSDNRTPLARPLTFDIAPSVTSGLLTIHLNHGTLEPSTPATLSVFSPSGSLVSSFTLHSSRFTLDLSSLPSGVYLTRLVSAGRTATRKLIIKH
jgi:hypothetical protein